MSPRLSSFPSIVCVLLSILVTAAQVPAQNFRGGINGTVTDPSGAVIADARVSATDTATSVVYKTLSSSAGQFAFQDLPLGTYDVTVTAGGFQVLRITNVPVSAGNMYTITARVAMASTAEKIQVEANAADVSLDTTSVNQTTNIPEKAVQDIPINGRDFSEFEALTPGAAGYGLPSVGSLAINGSRPNQVNYQLEGTDNNDIWWNLQAVNQSGISSLAGSILPMDSIEQFSMVTTSSPETGRNPGGTVNLALKSGTNNLHGSAYYFNRNEFFGVNNPFAPPGSKKSAERGQNAGFSLGGPIVKDKTFFFASYEWNNIFFASTVNATVPSLAYQAEAQTLLNYYGIALNPVSKNLLSNLWSPSLLSGPASSGNYFANAPVTGVSRNGLIKLDENFNLNNHVSLKGFIGQGHQQGPDGSVLPDYLTKGPLRVMNYSVIYDAVLRSNLTNQASFGFNFFDEKFRDANTSFNPVALGLNTGVTSPDLSGAPNISIAPSAAGTGVTNLLGGNSGFDPTGPVTQSGRTDKTWHVNDAVSYIKGAHQMRFGGEVRRVSVDDFYQTNGRGAFFFDGSQGPWDLPAGTTVATTPCTQLATRNLGTFAPGYAPSDTFDTNVLFLADFMAGCISSANIVEGNPKRQVYVNSFNLFAQDAWQVSKRLNLNYGLRWDYTGPVHNGDKNLTTFDPSVSGGLAVAGSTISNLYQQYWKSFSPRVGFAFQPRANGNMVVRGSYGLYWDSPYLIPFLNLHGTTNGGAIGVQDNPAGAEPVASASVSGAVIVPNQAIFPTLTQAIAGAGVISVFSVSPNYRSSYTENYNLSIQQSLGRSGIFQLAYIGSQSHHETNVADINQAPQGSAFANPTCAAQFADAGSGNQQCSRPYFSQFPDFSVINQVQSRYNANYNSLQAIVRTAAWHGVTSQLSYVWSHTLDQGTGLIPYLPQNSYNLAAEYGNSDLDQRHSFSGYVTYAIPGSSHGPSKLTHGWELNSLISFHTGNPYTPVSSSNSSGNGEYADRADATGVNPYAGVSHNIVNGLVQWFNPAAFTDPAQGQYGTLRRGQYFNPGYGDIDFSVLKNTPITERVTLQFRAEFFNIFNRTNLAPVGAPTAGDSGGQISSTVGVFWAAPAIGPGEPFNTQLSAKIVF
jgi:Carboxypeptidase regulatory-like domain